ncbi:hypothetical protein C5S30_01240 [ANME-1 cluster archaeon GoMg4]|nr:hypothetical protein [ANME-1 cluster archaeon GoMg4]
MFVIIRQGYETVIKLISATTTSKGLTVAARLDEREYEAGIKFSDDDIAQLQIYTTTSVVSRSHRSELPYSILFSLPITFPFSLIFTSWHN